MLVEPVAANMNLVAPRQGFLEGLRAECDRVGALLIFDEVITGFRLAQGGAEEYFDVTPDLWCFGKVIGGGLPVGAFGGSQRILAVARARRAPSTRRARSRAIRWRQPPAMTVLSHVTPDDLAILAERVTNFASGLQGAIREAGLFALCPNVGALMGLYLAEQETAAPTNFAEAKALCENGLYRTVLPRPARARRRTRTRRLRDPFRLARPHEGRPRARRSPSPPRPRRR